MSIPLSSFFFNLNLHWEKHWERQPMAVTECAANLRSAEKRSMGMAKGSSILLTTVYWGVSKGMRPRLLSMRPNKVAATALQIITAKHACSPFLKYPIPHPHLEADKRLAGPPLFVVYGPAAQGLADAILYYTRG